MVRSFDTQSFNPGIFRFHSPSLSVCFSSIVSYCLDECESGPILLGESEQYNNYLQRVFIHIMVSLKID